MAIAEARKDGLTLQQIADRYGISVPRVHQILAKVNAESS
jgi:DNA-directed RNA polymerase specialized sigma subunit